VGTLESENAPGVIHWSRNIKQGVTRQNVIVCNRRVELIHFQVLRARLSS